MKLNKIVVLAGVGVLIALAVINCSPFIAGEQGAKADSSELQNITVNSGGLELAQEPNNVDTAKSQNNSYTQQSSANTKLEGETELQPHVTNDLKSFDDLIKVEDGGAFMDTSLIDAMTSQEVANHISHLPNTMTQLRSVGIHERMLADTRRFETDNDDIYVHDFQCSDLLCGLMFEATNAESAHSALSSRAGRG